MSPQIANVPWRAILTPVENHWARLFLFLASHFVIKGSTFHWVHIFLLMNSSEELLFSSDSCISFVDLVFWSFHFTHISILLNLVKCSFFLILLFYPLPSTLICSGWLFSCLVSFFLRVSNYFIYFIYYFCSPFSPLQLNLQKVWGQNSDAVRFLFRPFCLEYELVVSITELKGRFGSGQFLVLLPISMLFLPLFKTKSKETDQPYSYFF